MTHVKMTHIKTPDVSGRESCTNTATTTCFFKPIEMCTFFFIRNHIAL